MAHCSVPIYQETTAKKEFPGCFSAFAQYWYIFFGVSYFYCNVNALHEHPIVNKPNNSIPPWAFNLKWLLQHPIYDANGQFLMLVDDLLLGILLHLSNQFEQSHRIFSCKAPKLSCSNDNVSLSGFKTASACSASCMAIVIVCSHTHTCTRSSIIKQSKLGLFVVRTRFINNHFVALQLTNLNACASMS
eukprot:m.117629 g.117629  ORF g.117629 m.117629 type:complete len:189 (+) comp13629_c1_seq9:2886-3452(+)